MARRLLVSLAVGAALPVLGLPAWIALHRTDLPEPDDADLLIEVPEVPEEDDAFAWFRKAAAAMVWDDSKESYAKLKSISNRETSDPEWIDGLARSNAPALRLLEQALEAPHIVVPFWTLDESADDPMDTLLPITTLVKISVAQAQPRASRGDATGALERALLGMRVGRKLSEAPAPSLLGMMVGVSAQGLSLAEVEHLLPDLALSSSRAREIAGRLEDMRWHGEAWRRTWSSEYRFVRDVVERTEANDANQVAELPGEAMDHPIVRILSLLPHDYAFQRNRTLSMAADLFRSLSERSRESCRDANRRDEARSHPSTLALLLSPNPAGRIVMEISRPNFVHFDIRRCHLATRISLVQALVALRAYENEHGGGLPPRLEELVPAYLDAVPEDRFDGQPIRWSRERATLYSVGEDFDDDGPPASPSQSDASAPAIRLPGRPRAS